MKKVESALKVLPDTLILEEVVRPKEIEKWFSKIAKWMSVANSVRSFGNLIDQVILEGKTIL